MSLEHLQSFIRQENNQEIQEHQEEKKQPNNLILTADIEFKEKQRQRYKEIGENIKVSERLRAKINKSVKNNIPADEILIDCIECISLMTGDTTFYKQNMKYLKDRA